MGKQTRRQLLRRTGRASGSLALAAAISPGPSGQSSAQVPEDSYQVGAYYFPNYHVDPRNEKRYGSGWTEWEDVEKVAARSRMSKWIRNSTSVRECYQAVAEGRRQLGADVREIENLPRQEDMRGEHESIWQWQEER